MMITIMNNVLFYVFIGTGVSAFITTKVLAQEVKGATLTLEQAKQIAIDRNPGLAAVRAQIDAAKARYGRAYNSFYPKLETKLGSEQNIVSKEEQSSTFGYLLANWNIYRGGLDVGGATIASLDAKKSELDYEIKRLAIENQVEDVFSNILFLRDLAAIKHRFIEINIDQQSRARQIFSRGGGSESDIVEFDLKNSTLNSELAQIEQDYRGYVVRLKSLLGEDIAKNPTPTGELPHQHLQSSLSDYINQTLSDVPQVKASALNLDIATHRAAAVKGRWLPQLDVQGKFGALPLSEGGERGKMGTSVALVATWEIFAGFDSVYEAKERIAEKSHADWQLKDTIKELLADLETRYGELITIQTRADLEKDNIRLSKRYYDLVFADFKRGYKNSADFSAAAQAWYDAEVQRKRLDLEFTQKKIALEQRLGKKVITATMRDVDEGGGRDKSK